MKYGNEIRNLLEPVSGKVSGDALIFIDGQGVDHDNILDKSLGGKEVEILLLSPSPLGG